MIRTKMRMGRMETITTNNLRTSLAGKKSRKLKQVTSNIDIDEHILEEEERKKAIARVKRVDLSNRITSASIDLSKRKKSGRPRKK